MMFLASNIGVADAGILALLGYATVFLGLILLMIVVTVIGKVFISMDKKKKAAAAATTVEAPTAESVSEETKSVAPGSAGELKLHDVEPKTAAMLMAIVANKLGKPLNELRFISIKEVK